MARHAKLELLATKLHDLAGFRAEMQKGVDDGTAKRVLRRLAEKH